MRNKYPLDMLEFVKKNIQGTSMKDMVSLINDRYGAGTISYLKLRAYLNNHKLHTGRDTRFKKGQEAHNKGKPFIAGGRSSETQFKKGHKPHNYKPVGAIIYDKDGYKVIKVSDEGRQRDKWCYLHRNNWEKAYGEIPQGHIVIFLDGDKENCNLDNLALIDRREHGVMTRQRLRTSDIELTKTGIAVAKLSLTVRERRGKNGEN